MRKCPFCAEDIPDEPAKCPWCNSNATVSTDTRFNQQQRKMLFLGVAVAILFFLILVIICGSNRTNETVEGSSQNPYQYQYDLGRKKAKEAVLCSEGDNFNKLSLYTKGLDEVSFSEDPYEEQKKDAFTKGWQSVDPDFK